MTLTTRVLWYTLALLLAGLASDCCAHADDVGAEGPEYSDPIPDLDVARRKLALGVAKLAANESTLVRWSAADAALIYQVARTHAATPEGQLRFLVRHSQCVLSPNPEPRRLARGNCGWSRLLVWGDRRPDTLHPVDWRRLRPRWRALRGYVARLVVDPDPPAPCDRAPVTWGGLMDFRDALDRGLLPATCRGTRNLGFYRAPTLEAIVQEILE